jgi:predicted RNase H-like nuclease
MRSVLGIDAAWTLRNPSGLALAEETTDGWRLVEVCSSYEQFLRRPSGSFSTSVPRTEEIIEASSVRIGRVVDLVAVDMPLSNAPITGRRVSDDVVSRQYGSRKCGTHSPSISRPGALSTLFVEGFRGHGFPLRTEPPVKSGLIEVYPHPALVELAGASERLKYKCGKMGKYWPHQSSEQRVQSLLQQWCVIVELLEKVFVGGVASALPQLRYPVAGSTRKAYEDALDAVVCAWVGIKVLEGAAEAYGDEESAIWIPVSHARKPQS